VHSKNPQLRPSLTASKQVGSDSIFSLQVTALPYEPFAAVGFRVACWNQMFGALVEVIYPHSAYFHNYLEHSKDSTRGLHSVNQLLNAATIDSAKASSGESVIICQLLKA